MKRCYFVIPSAQETRQLQDIPIALLLTVVPVRGGTIAFCSRQKVAICNRALGKGFEAVLEE